VSGKGDSPRPMDITKTEFDIKFDKIFIKKSGKSRKGMPARKGWKK